MFQREINGLIFFSYSLIGFDLEMVFKYEKICDQ